MTTNPDTEAETETSTIDVWSDTVPGPRQRHVYRRTGRPATGARFEHVARDYHYATTTVIERPTTWPATRLRAERVVAYLDDELPVDSPAQRAQRGLTVPRLLGWLSSFPGATWQQRWLSSGLSEAGAAWHADAPATGVRRDADRIGPWA